MKDTELSVIILVYNTEEYFKRCLDSVLLATRQTESAEILVINDGSPGNIDELIKEYLEKDSDIVTYYKKDNTGPGDSRNFGIEKSHGKYVTFVDSDDEVHKNYYKEAIETMHKKNADIVVVDIETNKAGEKHRTHAKNVNIEDDRWGCIDISIMPQPCNKIVKQELYKYVDYPYGVIYEDLATTLILLLKAENVVYIPKMYYKYYIRIGSIMHREFSEKKFEIIDVLKILFLRIDKLDDVLVDEKNRAKNAAYYQRIYFELLEPLANEDFDKRYRLAKKLCKKIKKMHKEMSKNVYYRMELNNTGRVLRKFYAQLVDFALYNNLPYLLSKILPKATYYNVQYVGDMWRKGEENNG